MRAWRCLASAIALLIAIDADAALAESASNPKSALVAELQEAVRTDDRAWLAAHLHFPVRYYGRKDELIRSKAWFNKHYAIVIGPELKAANLAQDPEDIFENWQGIMVGEGSRNIWLRNFGADTELKYEIITINNSD
jgi:hypothetical protein